MDQHDAAGRGRDSRVPGRRTGRRGRAPKSGVLAALVLLPTVAWAQSPPCTDYLEGQCVVQVQAPIGYTGWQTQGWAYYCTGDHPYFKGLRYDVGNSFTFDNSCFTVAENEFAEAGNDGKFDALITNWCLNSQQLVISLACYDHK